MQKKWNIGDWFHRRGHLEDPDPGQAAPQTQPAGEETAAAQTADEAPPPCGPTDLPEVQGAMLALWRLWSGDDAPPLLDLLGGKEPQALHMDSQALERERLHLALQLEQYAQKRLDKIQKQGQEPCLNAFCKIFLAKDRMTAWSFVFPPVGKGAAMGGQSVGLALEESGVTTGIDSAAMVSIFQEPVYYKLVPIAVGTPVIQGRSGTVEERFPRTLCKEVKLDENGVADYRAGHYAQVVEKGAVICGITPPEKGAAGIRVDGKLVEPKAVQPADIPAGTNTVLSEDGRQLLSAIDGHLEYRNGKFHVRALLEIRGDVDYATGNIDFPGDVHIFGDIRENFSVHATGSISVDGMVEAASVEAGGDLVITRGVVGDNRALLRCRGTVRVKYLENCVVYAGGAIYADCIMNSQIFSDDMISVTSGRGSIIGGALTAAHIIRAEMIGAQSGRRTDLTLGVLPYVQSEIANIKEDLRALEQEREKLDKELAYLAQSQGLEGSSEKLAKARMRRSVLGIKERQLTRRKERLAPQKADLARCRLECGAVYPVTDLKVGESVWCAKQMRRHCRVTYDTETGELKERT